MSLVLVMFKKYFLPNLLVGSGLVAGGLGTAALWDKGKTYVAERRERNRIIAEHRQQTPSERL